MFVNPLFVRLTSLRIILYSDEQPVLTKPDVRLVHMT